MTVTNVLIYIVLILVTSIFYMIKKNFQYWKDRRVPYEEPHFYYGNAKGFRTTKHMNFILRDFYNKVKNVDSPFAGFYLMSKPIAVITDLDLVKNILIKDFNTFNDRYMFFNEKDDPLTANVFLLDGERWKPLRKKMTPTFTSGKMKYMFPTLQGVAKELEVAFKNSMTENPSVEIVDLLARFTTDVIGKCGFGIECNSLRDPSSEFLYQGRSILTNLRHNSTPMRMFMMAFPRIARKLRMRFLRDDTHEFFMTATNETVEFREKNNIQRNDFLNILMEMRAENKTGMTIEEIAAQTLLFFIAGFDTSSTTMSFALYELARNQDIQDRLRSEILDTLNDEELTYEATNNMQYLDQVICGKFFYIYIFVIYVNYVINTRWLILERFLRVIVLVLTI